MNKLTETDVKYLAGLFDADASLSLVIRNNCAALSLQFKQKEPKMMLVKPLLDKIGGNLYHNVSHGKEMGYRGVSVWTLNRRADIEKLLPRLVKHMIVKAKHWQRLLDLWRKHRGAPLTDEVQGSLKEEARNSRRTIGPLKPKKFASWAWIAGFMDGDGCYTCRYQPNQRRWNISMQSRGAKEDAIAHQYLQLAMGGTTKIDNQGYSKWYRGCGVPHATFVFKTFPKLVRHSRMKKKQIEKIIHTLRQRLSEMAPTGEATVY